MLWSLKKVDITLYTWNQYVISQLYPQFKNLKQNYKWTATLILYLKNITQNWYSTTDITWNLYNKVILLITQ